MIDRTGRKLPTCYLFERCTGGILNLRFDSDILESFYSECSFPRGRGRFRFCSIFGIFASIIWLIYFSALQPTSWVYYLIGCFLIIILSITSLCLSYVRIIFKRYFLWICGIHACVFVFILLLSFIPTKPAASLCFNLCIITQSVLLLYTMIPLRLWQHVILCGSVSIVHIILSSTRYGPIGFSPVLIQIVAHFCVHSIGIILHLMSQVWRRSTFLRLGQNSLIQKALKKEQELRNDMICSLMPAEVAHEVMQDVGKENTNDAHIDTKDEKIKKKKTGDEFGVGFSDEFDTDCTAECPQKKTSVASEKGMKAAPVDDKESPRGSIVAKTLDPPRAVTFRKFHVNQLENVSVLFADIVGFTKMSSKKTASQLVYLLNDLFGRFDRLCELIGCEKIATLGDCYYCVAGCPKPVDDHAERTVELGRAMCVAIQQFDEDHQEEVNMRVGVHTGKVICGIVGTRRFKFDVWSNDVTLANEMESSGRAGLVHISEATYEFVKDVYTVSEGESVPDLRHLKVLVEYFNEAEKIFAIKHTQNQENIKTYFIEERKDGKPICVLPPSVVAGHKGDVEAESASKPLISGKEFGKPTFPFDGGVAVASAGENQIAPTVSTVIQERNMSVEQLEANLTPGSRGSDVEMLDALKDFSRPEAVFAFPPMSRFSLNFHSPEMEAVYRQIGLCQPRLKPDKGISWSMPRITPVINATLQTILLIAYTFTCLFVFPDSRFATVSSAFYILASLSITLHLLLMLLLLLDLAVWGWSVSRPATASPACSWRRCVTRTYVTCFRWYQRNLLGALLLLLPTAVILSNFSHCLFTSGTGGQESATVPQSLPPSWFIAYYRQLVGLFLVFTLFNFTLFTTFSSWTKTLSALVACLATIGLLLVPAGLGWLTPTTSPLLLFTSVWSLDVSVPDLTGYQEDARDLPVWMVSVLSDTFRVELIVILVTMLFLVGALNREFDISFRLTYHRDYETLQAKRAIARQQKQSVWLLDNIIPSYIMEDLRRTNKYSRHIEDAAVVFACISNFAEFYDEQYQGGQEMLRVLNEIFADFEHQLADQKYRQVEKIKTNGACFMVASGLDLQERKRVRRPDGHLHALMDFAQDLIHILDDFNRQMFNFQFEMKVGYNIGDLTAGVIGTTKLLYDIWGDTVNVASRMYSTGMKGRIQVTEAVAERLGSRYEFEYRGEVTVKGKGNMKTYLLSGRRTEPKDA